ncbi:MAG TPA: GyrI-like domain-containing protein [Acidimicrobiales bacterium]|nr:GyrI-like domain-containing protein [Acidimicrobiales bacterium]
MTVTLSAADVAPLYRARAGRVDLVEVPELAFAGVDGSGAPGGPAFARALGALYPVAYGIRFSLRKRGVDERVSPLEALWWTPHSADDFAAAVSGGGYSEEEKAAWSWRALIRLPAATDDTLIAEVKAQAAARRPEGAEALEEVRFFPWREGLSVQTLHVGPYSAELPTVQLLHDFIAGHGLAATGHHHEIYLGDPRRCAPERLRTILRQPVARSG